MQSLLLAKYLAIMPAFLGNVSARSQGNEKAKYFAPILLTKKIFCTCICPSEDFLERRNPTVEIAKRMPVKPSKIKSPKA